MTIRGWSDAWQPLFDGFGRMRTAWPARGWSWDPRLACVTSTFSAEFEPKARAAIGLALPAEWTSATLLRAPQTLQELVERVGGIRPGQIVASAGPAAGLLAYGLWWPWGDGETISFRIGLADVDANREPTLKFRETFGVTA